MNHFNMVKYGDMARKDTKFSKGNIGNPKGRPKGSQNKKTVAEKEKYDSIMELIEQRMLQGDDVINNLTAARAAELYVNLLNYKKPKLSSNKNENDNNVSGNVTFTLSFDGLNPDPNAGE